MSEEKKRYETEWSFSFGNLGESISNTLASLGIGEEAEVKSASFVEPLAGATTARMVLEPTVGQTTVSALVNSDNLIEADVTYIGEVKFEVKAEEASKAVVLRQTMTGDGLRPIKDAIGSFARRDDLKWDMRLTPNIPLDLRINNGVTRNDFDLSGLQLQALRINGGTGQTDLKLPTMGGQYPVDINSGTGELLVDVPAGAHIKLNANNGTGKTAIAIGAGAVVDAHITGGVGSCEVTVPADAAVRLKATTGLGKVRVPENFVRIKVDEFVATVGTWETPNYANAEDTIDIQYEGGIGGFTIKLV